MNIVGVNATYLVCGCQLPFLGEEVSFTVVNKILLNDTIYIL